MHTPLKIVVTAALLSAYLSIVGCKSNNDNHLQLRHTFKVVQTSAVDDSFDFHMTWFVPPAVLFGNEQNSIIANMGLVSRPKQNPRLTINNETRLRLEEIAISRLEQELSDNDMCAQGYKIKQTKWLERSIGFIGSCR